MEVEAEQPDVVALVLLVVAEEVSADLEVALACVGLRTDFEIEVEPEALEPAMPLQANSRINSESGGPGARLHEGVVIGRCVEKSAPAIPLRLARFRSKNRC